MNSIADTRAAFRSLHESGFFLIPNAWDVGSAVRLAKLGFRAIASTSAGAAWALGKDDGELTRDEVLAHLRILVAATDLPVNADFENGFADDPEDVALNVAMAVDTGVAGISVEDWSGTAFYEAGLATDRIAAARAAIKASDPAVMLIGRTEHFRTAEKPKGDSIARMVAYADAGADILFAPGLNDPGAIKELVAAVAPKPVNVITATGDPQLAALAALGVRRASVGGSLAKAAWDGFDAAANLLTLFK